MEFWESLMRTAAALAVVLGLMLVALKAFRRLRGTIGPHPGGAPVIRLLGSSSLDPRKHIAVVAVAEQWLVVGVTPDAIVPLGRVRQPVPAAVDQSSVPPQWKASCRSAGAPAAGGPAER